MNILAVDPGRSKCGVAILNAAGKVLFREIIPTEKMNSRLASILEKWRIDYAVHGASTGAQEMHQLLENLAGESTHKSTFTVHSIDERNSTLEARALYWQANPRRGWRRLLPLSLLTPPEDIDDFAAVVLGHRFLSNYSEKYGISST